MSLQNTSLNKLTLISSSLFLLFFLGCSSVADVEEEALVTNETTEDESIDQTEEIDDNSDDGDSSEAEVYDITSILTIFSNTMDGDLSNYTIGEKYVTITTKDLPDHKSPYYEGTNWENEMYEANNTKGFHQNPGSIGEQNVVFNIPINPTSADVKEETPMGPMGIARNGVLIFNQYAAGGAGLDDEIVSFDQYNGHPASTAYHYHIEPLALTETFGEDAILGLLLDGFPVYGPLEKGVVLTTEDLDDFHGHFGETKEFPNGIYHYHITATDPYINGDGFYGIVGNIAR